MEQLSQFSHRITVQSHVDMRWALINSEWALLSSEWVLIMCVELYSAPLCTGSHVRPVWAPGTNWAAAQAVVGTCAGLPTVQCVGTARTPLMLMLTRSRIKVIIDKSAAFPASPWLMLLSMNVIILMRPLMVQLLHVQQYPETFSECSGMRAGLYFAVCMQPPVCAGEAIYFQIAAG